MNSQRKQNKARQTMCIFNRIHYDYQFYFYQQNLQNQSTKIGIGHPRGNFQNDTANDSDTSASAVLISATDVRIYNC